MRRTYRQNKETGKFEEVTPFLARPTQNVTDDIAPFISPVDGSHITTKRQLESHNRRNGVTNDLDSLKEKTSRHLARQNNGLSKKERINDLVRSYDYVQHNSRS